MISAQPLLFEYENDTQFFEEFLACIDVFDDIDEVLIHLNYRASLKDMRCISPNCNAKIWVSGYEHLKTFLYIEDCIFHTLLISYSCTEFHNKMWEKVNLGTAGIYKDLVTWGDD